jgi:tetratricopeptide (TPR) repeat protein
MRPYWGAVLCALSLTGSAHAAPIETMAPAPQLLPAAPPQSAAGSDYLAGVAALKQQDLAAARAAFDRAARASPNAPAPLIGLAEVALRQRKPGDAEKYLRRALEAAPLDSALQIVWGRFLLGQGRAEEARAAFEKAAALDPKNVRPRVDLGDVHLFVLKQPQKAVAAYKGALEVEPGNVGVLIALARAQQAAGQAAAARDSIERAIALAPANPLPLLVGAELDAQNGRTEEALAAYDRAIATVPRIAQPRLAKAAFLLRLDRPEAALAEYRKVLEIDPKNVMALVSVGVLQAQANRPEEAKQSFAAAVAADPQVPRILNDIAWTEVERKGNLDRALIMAREAVSAAPDAPAYRDTLGWVLRARGELRPAEAELEKAAAKAGKPDVLTHLATVRAELGERQAAVETLRRALALDPAYRPALDLQQRLATTEPQRQ